MTNPTRRRGQPPKYVIHNGEPVVGLSRMPQKVRRKRPDGTVVEVPDAAGRCASAGAADGRHVRLSPRAAFAGDRAAHSAWRTPGSCPRAWPVSASFLPLASPAWQSGVPARAARGPPAPGLVGPLAGPGPRPVVRPAPAPRVVRWATRRAASVPSRRHTTFTKRALPLQINKSVAISIADG
jgi:hypothetical protein